MKQDVGNTKHETAKTGSPNILQLIIWSPPMDRFYLQTVIFGPLSWIASKIFTGHQKNENGPHVVFGPPV
jgi:hypothetical protein